MSGLYTSARQSFLDGDLSWSRDIIRVAIVSGYKANLKTDHMMSDLPEGAVVALSDPLENKTSDDGTANADPVVWSRVEGQGDALVLFVDRGAPVLSPLVAYLDDVSGLPVVPTKGAVMLSWSKGAGKIFKL